MPQSYSRIVVRRQDGKAEVIGRPGHVDLHAVARTLAASGATVISVRHEVIGSGGQHDWKNGQHVPPSGAPRTIAILKA